MIFLQEIARQILKEKDKWGNFSIICPNKRTTDYIKYYISKEIKKTIWSPKFMNLSELVNQFSDFDKADDLFLQIELFKSFKKIMFENENFGDYDFEKFQGIGEIILKDFNELDNYLVDVSSIFKTITDFENIDFIDDILNDEQKNAIKEFLGYFSTDKLSEEKEYFMQLWSKIPEIYTDFNKKLVSKKITYNGFINKHICEKISSREINFSKYDKYIFVGFNAFTKAQKIFLKEIKKQDRALFYWDYDNFYINNKDNEAGLFIRENIKLFGDDLKINRDNLLKDKNINIIGFPLEIAQTKAIPTLLKKLNIDITDKQQLAKTAIVMPDEKLLFPVLHSLPEEIKQINVTVGFPFNNSAVFSLVQSWFFILQKSATEKKIYYKDLLKFLNNQLLNEIIKENREYVLKEIEKMKMVYLDLESLSKIKNSTLKIIFDPQNAKSIDVLLENILVFLEKIFRFVSADKRTVETEAIYQFYTHLLSIQSLISNELAEDKKFITVRTLLKYLLRQLMGIHIPFTGKSLAGMQVMTLMETRNIDFENLIIINLNEDVIPHKPSRNSLISEFMRKSFELPLLIYQDSIFAYLFFRLIQNAKKITLTYSNLISEKSKEKSRFVQQLEKETNLIKHENIQEYSESIQPIRSKDITISKDDSIFKIMKEKYLSQKKSMSASSLNTYISCSLHFYYKYIAQIELIEEEELDFDIDAIRFGNIFHNSMQDLYRPYTSKIVEASDIEQMNKKAEEVVKNQILKEFNNNQEALHTGINNILFNVIVKYIKKTLTFDKQNVPFKLIAPEKFFNGKLNFNINGESNSVSIVSIFDRIQEKDNKIAIIDYKTGDTKNQITNLDSLFDSNKDYKLKAMFQMLIYSVVYKQENQDKYFEPLIFNTKQIGKDYDANLKFKKNNIDSYSVELFELFEEKLSSLLSEIFDTEKDFTQTENTKNCLFCEYRGLCGI
ncbi:MAG: PD-(D/E)XK nuclease family protein [Bacteroidota bacterium]|nr:PD-(D/E)XK nuclease family protein [Bacteroidota bacterium]